MTLTIGMRELATEHLQSGVANTASALIQLLARVRRRHRPIGGDELVRRPPPMSSPTWRSSGIELLAAVARRLAFTLTLRAQLRDAVFMCAATVLALEFERARVRRCSGSTRPP